MDKHPIQGEVEIPAVASCFRNWGKLQPDGPLPRVSYSDFLVFKPIHIHYWNPECNVFTIEGTTLCVCAHGNGGEG